MQDDTFLQFPLCSLNTVCHLGNNTTCSKSGIVDGLSTGLRQTISIVNDTILSHNQRFHFSFNGLLYLQTYEHPIQQGDVFSISVIE